MGTTMQRINERDGAMTKSPRFYETRENDGEANVEDRVTVHADLRISPHNSTSVRHLTTLRVYCPSKMRSMAELIVVFRVLRSMPYISSSFLLTSLLVTVLRSASLKTS